MHTLAQNDDRVEVNYQLQSAAVTNKDVGPLNLGKTSITDGAPAGIAKHPEITRLHLELTKITDAGLI